MIVILTGKMKRKIKNMNVKKRWIQDVAYEIYINNDFSWMLIVCMYLQWSRKSSVSRDIGINIFNVSFEVIINVLYKSLVWKHFLIHIFNMSKTKNELLMGGSWSECVDSTGEGPRVSVQREWAVTAETGGCKQVRAMSSLLSHS